MQRLVIGYHIMWTAYGYWLPNDPRGSTSKRIARDVIAELGELHMGRKKIQPAYRELREFYEKAEHVLKHPLRELDRADLSLCADAIRGVVEEQKYTCYACAIMPDHVHALVWFPLPGQLSGLVQVWKKRTSVEVKRFVFAVERAYAGAERIHRTVKTECLASVRRIRRVRYYRIAG